MGVCSCRKRAELFCYGHRKAVCSSCILDHPNCCIGTYLEWLRDSDYEEPSCPVCAGTFDEASPSMRLTCLHIIHPTCLEHYASQLPAHTAQAGYACQKCTKPIIPVQDDKTDLANTLRDVLTTQNWAKTFMDGSASLPLGDLSGVKSPGRDVANTDSREPFIFTPVSRKGGKGDVEDIGFDSDSAENKYRRRGVMQLLVALGIATPGQGGHVLNSKRIVVLFLLISMVLFFWLLYKSSNPPLRN